MPLAPNAVTSATLQGWYDASVEISADGTAMGTVTDRSSYAKNLTQATAGQKPTIQTASDGRRYYKFDGVDDYVTASTAVDWKFLNSGTHVVFAVVTIDAHSVDGRSTILDTGGLSAANIGVWLTFDNRGSTNGGPNGIQARATRNASPNDVYQMIEGDQSIKAGVRQLIAIYAQSSSAALRVANELGQHVTDSSVTYSNTTPTGALRLGARTSGTTLPINGRIHEIACFTGSMSSSDFDDVCKYLDHKWAITTWSADVSNVAIEATSTYDAFPSAEVTRTGQLVAVARRAANHVSGFGNVVQWRSSDLGTTWSAEGVIFTGSAQPGGGCDLRDTGLIKMANGNLLLTLSIRAVGGSGGSVPDGCRYATSANNGATWSTSTPSVMNTMNDPFTGFSRTSTTPCLLPNGDILWPIYGNNRSDLAASHNADSDDTRWVKVMKSTDNASTWSYLADIGSSGDATGWGEATIVVSPTSGNLIALVRNSVENGLYRSVSTDSGATWSNLAATSPVTDDSEAVLKDASSSPKADYSPRGLLVATQRSASTDLGFIVFSTDDGATWQRGSALSTTKPFEYCDVAVTSDKVIFVYSLEASSTDADMFANRYAEFNVTANSLHETAHAVSAVATLTTSSLHVTGHLVAAAPQINVLANTLHVTAHVVTVPLIANAGSLHVTGHTVGAVPATKVGATSLNVNAYVVTAFPSTKVPADSLHTTLHIVRIPPKANTLHTVVHSGSTGGVTRGSAIHPIVVPLNGQSPPYTPEFLTTVNATPQILVALLEGDVTSNPVPVLAGASVTFSLHELGGAQLFEHAAVLNNAADGLAHYQVQSGELASAGTYLGRFHVTYLEGGMKQAFPGDRYIEVTVQ